MKEKTTERDDADMAGGTDRFAQMSGRFGLELLYGREGTKSGERSGNEASG
jgi:hypothetical protein